MEPSFLIGESLQFGWQTLRAHSALVFQLVLSVFALQVAFEIVVRVLLHTALGMLAAATLVVLLVLVGVGVTVITLKLARGEKAAYNEMIPHPRLVIRLLLAGLLSVGIALVPFFVSAFVILFCIPYVQSVSLASQPSSVFIPLAVVLAAAVVLTAYLMLRFALVRFAVIDGATIKGSLRESARLTRGSMWRMLWFFLVVIGLNIAGALFFLVGLLVTIPVSALAYAHIYQQLKSRIEEKA